MRRLPLVGAVVTVAGLAVAFAPSLGDDLTPTYAAVVLVGLGAMLLGIAGVRGRLVSERRYATPPERETRPTPPTPGDEFDRRLADLAPASTREGKSERAAIRERLEAAAVNVLASEGYDRETAGALLESGEWTNDPFAAAFFADREPTQSTGERVRGLLADRTAFEREARHAAAAIAARAEGDHE